MNQSQTANYIIGVLGKKGSGKSFEIKRMLIYIDRYIVIDPMGEYDNCVIAESYDELYSYIQGFHSGKFGVACRFENEDDLEQLWQLSNEINDFTLVVEEADMYADSNDVHPALLNRLKHGRHKGRNTIWISRSPYEIHRYLTRQTDIIICFLQTEPRDVKYLENYTFDKDVTQLNYKEYEYAVWLSYPGASELLTKFKISQKKLDK